jgi:hypothetical protein
MRLQKLYLKPTMQQRGWKSEAAARLGGAGSSMLGR